MIGKGVMVIGPVGPPVDPVGEHLVGALLDRAGSAWPALVEENCHGWWLRHTDTTMWWAGAVLAHHQGEDLGSLARGIDLAEKFYATQGAPVRFQICPACPHGLDAVLTQRGYHRESPMSLQTASTAQVLDRISAPALHVSIRDHAHPVWFATWAAVHAPEADPGPELRLLERINPPSGYVTVYATGRAVAVGRAVAERGWTGVFGMATLPHARGLGAARAVLVALAVWAMSQDAPRLYLQVEADNAAARGLYELAGFAETANYHYRVRKRP